MDCAFCGSTRNWFYLIFFIYLSRLHLSTFLIMESPNLSSHYYVSYYYYPFWCYFLTNRSLIGPNQSGIVSNVFRFFTLNLSTFLIMESPTIRVFSCHYNIYYYHLFFCYSLLIVLFIGFNQGGIDEFLWCFFNEEM